MAKMMQAVEDEDEDGDSEEKAAAEESEHESEESEQESEESESEESDSDTESQSEDEVDYISIKCSQRLTFILLKNAGDNAKKGNLEPRVKRHDGRLASLKKGNYLVEANVERLKDEMKDIKEKCEALQADLNSVIDLC